MKRNEFLDVLKTNTEDLAKDEQERLLSYYNELIDDMTENGLTEEEAVAELANESLVRKENRTDSTASSSCSTLIVESSGQDIVLKTAEDGIFQLDYDPDLCEVNVSDEESVRRIVVNYVEAEKPGPESGPLDYLKYFGSAIVRPHAVVTVYLPAEEYQCADIHTRSGDIYADYAFNDLFRTASISGDLYLQKEMHLNDLEIDTTSGDVHILSSSLTAETALISTVSGDIRPRNSLSSRTLTAKSVSGDLKFKSVNAEDAEFRTVSGDIDCRAVTAVKQFTGRTTSGDIDIETLDCPLAKISTHSGDVDVKTAGHAVCRASSSSGEIRTPEVQTGPDVLTVSTKSGDIKVRNLN